MRAVDVILLDTTFWGGIRPASRQRASARRWGFNGVAVHIVRRAGHPTCHDAASGRGASELTFAADAHYHHLRDDVIAGGPLPYVNGAIRVPDAPGLGVTLDHNNFSRISPNCFASGAVTRTIAILPSRLVRARSEPGLGGPDGFGDPRPVDDRRRTHAMAGRLAGKTALITAAGQGMGQAVAVAMAREGAAVIATDLNEGLLEGYGAMSGITARKLDVLDDEAVRGSIGLLPPLDVLFNCAGYVHHGTILRVRAEGLGLQHGRSTCAPCTSRSRRRCLRWSSASRRPARARRSSTWPRWPARSRASRTASSTAPARRP